MMRRFNRLWRMAIWLSFIVIVSVSAIRSTTDVVIWPTAYQPSLEYNPLEELGRKVNIMTSREEAPYKVLRLIKDKLYQFSPQEKTKLMYQYHAYLQYERSVYDEKIFYQGNHKMVYKYFYYAYRPEWIQQIKEKPFKDIMLELDESGYYLKRSNSLYHPFIDYKRLKETFNGMSEEGTYYLEIHALADIVSEREDPKKSNYYNEVEKLLLKCDNFINKYPLSAKRHEVQALFNEELRVYIFGNESFESYDKSTGKVDQSLLNSYLRLSKELSTKNLGLILNRYTKMVMRNDRIVVDEFLQYMHLGIERNRSDYFVSRGDPIEVKTSLVSFSGVQQYIPQIEGYRYREDMSRFNEKLLENVYKYVYQGWNRGYQFQNAKVESTYDITFARRDILSLYQRIEIKHEGGQAYQNIECLNIDFAKGKVIKFKDLFVDYDLQKRKILEVLNQGITNFDIGAFERVESIELDNINNFVITNDGVEVTFRVLDDIGSVVDFITVELSYSEFYTIIDPEFRF